VCPHFRLGAAFCLIACFGALLAQVIIGIRPKNNSLIQDWSNKHLISTASKATASILSPNIDPRAWNAWLERNYALFQPVRKPPVTSPFPDKKPKFKTGWAVSLGGTAANSGLQPALSRPLWRLLRYRESQPPVGLPGRLWPHQDLARALPGRQETGLRRKPARRFRFPRAAVGVCRRGNRDRAVQYATATNPRSSPFMDYASDVACVGADDGTLCSITGVFKGTPAKDICATVFSGRILTAPVYDPGAQRVFLSDGNYVCAYDSSLNLKNSIRMRIATHTFLRIQ